MDDETMITIFAAIAAAISFVAVALPFLKKSDQKEKYKSIIEKQGVHSFLIVMSTAANIRAASTMSSPRVAAWSRSMALNCTAALPE